MHVLVLQHVPCETMGGLEQALRTSNVTYEYRKLYESAEVPPHVECDGLIVLGGPMNVYEEGQYPFLKADTALIQEAVSFGIPTLGICLGAQLIAKACGARVIKGAQKEIGWYQLNLTPAGRKCRVFQGLPKQFKVFEWHGDTFEIPLGGVNLASSALFPNQSFRVGNAYALQFHLEVSEEMVAAWMDAYAGELVTLAYIDPRKIREETAKYIADLNQVATQFYGNFIHILRNK